MHVIFPAQSAAMELQTAIHAYMADTKNEWFAYQIDSNIHESQKKQLRAHIVQLSSAIERLRARMHCSVRLLHSNSQPVIADRNVKVLNPEVDGTKYATLCRLWDSFSEFKPIRLTDIPGNATVEQLDEYSKAMACVLKAAIKQVGMRDPLKHLGLRSVDCPQHTGFDLAKSFKVVRAILTDALEQQLFWVQKGKNEFSNTDQALFQECRFDFQNMTPQLHKRHSDFVQQIIVPLRTAVEAWIKSIIPEKTWSIWTIRDLSLDLVLERHREGQDFRILDWENRMESGQWEKTDVATLIGVPGTAEKEEALTDVLETEIDAHYHQLDPRTKALILHLIHMSSERVIPGTGVPRPGQAANVVVDPIPRYSFFLREPIVLPEHIGTDETSLTLGNLIGTKILQQQF